MLKSLLTASALAALMAAAPAVAQNANPATPPAAGDQATPKPLAPSAGTPATPAPDASDNQAAAPAATEAPAATKQVADTEKFLNQQQDSQILASSIIGQTVYDSADNNLGSVTDIVLAKDGSMDAVIIGVGGFLGIGQKNVAVSIDAINQTTDDNGNLKLVLDVTKDDLDSAPQFVTLADVKAKQLHDQQMQQPTDGGMAPAPTPAPAK
jgi:hypothetical protein